jgi:hypothetical protein
MIAAEPVREDHRRPDTRHLVVQLAPGPVQERHRDRLARFGESAPPQSRPPPRARLEPDQLEQIADHPVGGEAFPRHRGGVSAGPRIVGLDRFDGARRLVDRAEGM